MDEQHKQDRLTNIHAGACGTIFPSGAILKPCVCGHKPKEHQYLYEEESLAEWYLNCEIEGCLCAGFKQMDNFAYVKWIHEKKNS